MNLLVIYWVIFYLKSTRSEFQLTILHTNNVHAQYEEILEEEKGKSYGGVARAAYLIKKAKEERKTGGPAVLYLDAGGMFCGSIWFTVHSYQGVAKILNKLEVDVYNVGDHEFDVSLEGLKNFTRLINFPMVSTNIKLNKEVDLGKKIKRSIIKTIDGVKVGFVGYLRSDLLLWADKGTIEVMDIMVALQKECHRLTYEEDVKVIIALGHAGYEIDKLVAQTVEHIDVIIGAHSNTFLWNGKVPDEELASGPYPTKVTRRDGSLVLIVHAYRHLKYMGKINLRFTKDGGIRGFFGIPILMDSSVPKDPEMDGLVQEMKKDIEMYDNKILGKCGVYLGGTQCQHQECNFGNLVMDAIIEYNALRYRGPGWTDAAVALINSGSLVKDIDAPRQNQTIFYGNIMRSLPFSDMLYTAWIKGSDLRFVLELSTERLDQSSSRGEFFLMSGLKVMFNFDDRFGDRVKFVKVRCANCDIPEYFPLSDEDYYKVIITSFLLKGGAGYSIIRDVVREPKSLGKRDTTLLIEFFQKVQYVTPETGGRLIHYDKEYDGATSNCAILRYFHLMLMIFSVSLNTKY